jgi:hypothetical protein
MSRKPIAPGQRFRSTDYDLLWVVGEVFDDACGCPHARLHLAEDRWTQKTLGCAELADPRKFVPADEPGEGETSRLSLFRKRRVA